MTRPRLCATCHTRATHAVEEQRPATRITLNGQAIPFVVTQSTYYCAAHIPSGLL